MRAIGIGLGPGSALVATTNQSNLDDAIRRLIQSLEHYQAFSPELAGDYDVIEIRRTWHFDVSVRLY